LRFFSSKFCISDLRWQRFVAKELWYLLLHDDQNPQVCAHEHYAHRDITLQCLEISITLTILVASQDKSQV
jgi:hypothetical protein